MTFGLSSTKPSCGQKSGSCIEFTQEYVSELDGKTSLKLASSEYDGEFENTSVKSAEGYSKSDQNENVDSDTDDNRSCESNYGLLSKHRECHVPSESHLNPSTCSSSHRPISLPNLTSVLPQIITTTCESENSYSASIYEYDAEDYDDRMSSCTSGLNSTACSSVSGHEVNNSPCRLRSGSSTSETIRHHTLFHWEHLDENRRHSCCSCLCGGDSGASSVVSEEENRKKMPPFSKDEFSGLEDTDKVTEHHPRSRRDEISASNTLIHNTVTTNAITDDGQQSEEQSTGQGVDTRIKFSIAPLPGKRGFRQWHDALRAMCRLPSGIPRDLRRKVWLCLADHYLKHVKVDWDKTVRYTFNDRSNPDDEKLGVQIVKDLHRTGYSGFSSGEGAEAGRALLKRVLLAYARWNKQIGYCQGFNVLAATLLQVCEGNEVDALKLMIYLIDRVLPQNYFSHNLRALSVDMAVFRDLLRSQQPILSAHFDKLQSLANSVPYSSGISSNVNGASCSAASAAVTYEPPLTNVFTMQWFLTLFATCLPKPTVLRVWDCIFLEGSEMLLRVALAVWENISERILQVETADEFYSLMANIQSEMFEYNLIDCETLIQTVYSMGPSPFTNLSELREKYTYNITPFSPMHPPKSSHSSGSVGAGVRGSAGGGSSSSVDKSKQSSDDENECEDRAAFMRCFPNFYPSSITNTLTSPASKCSKDFFSGDESGGSGTAINQMGTGVGHGLLGSSSIGGHHGSGTDSLLNASPGAYSSPSDPTLPLSAPLERMSTDIHALKKQYSKLQQRMQQVHVIYYGGRSASDGSGTEKPVEVVNPMKTNLAINHLFVVNNDQTRSQLPVAPQSTSPGGSTTDATGGAWGNSYNSCSQAVNHLTIKPYIPPSATLETLPAAAASSSPLPHSSSSCTSASASECGAGPLLTSNSSLSSSSRVKGGGGPNDSRSGRRRKSLQAPSVSTSPRSTCSSPGVAIYPTEMGKGKRCQADSLSVDEEGTGNLSSPVTLSCRQDTLSSSHNNLPEMTSSSTEQPLDAPLNTTSPSPLSDGPKTATESSNSREPKHQGDNSNVHSFNFNATPFCSSPTETQNLNSGIGSNVSSSASNVPPASSSSTSAKSMYRKAPLKPNIRPNLGSNDRPRIYNPFPVNYVHNTKLRKGKSLGLYCDSRSNGKGGPSNGTSGGSTASEGVLARLRLK